MPSRFPLARRLLVLLVLVGAIAASDQVTKRLAEERLARRGPVRVIPGFDLRLARNPGAAWGLLSDVRETYRKPFFVGVSVATMLFILVLYARLDDRSGRQRVALVLVLGGAIGNFVDRMAYGHVVDFIDWHLTIAGRVRHWPTFNVADAAITVGVLILALDIIPRRGTRATDRERPGDSDEASA